MKRHAFGLLAAVVYIVPALGSSVIIHVLPDKLIDCPLSIEAKDSGFGKHLSVLYRTNTSTLDHYLSAELAVSDEDERVAECPIEKVWTDKGVRFDFTIAPNYISASRFTITERAHDGGKRPMPGFTAYWFYLRDFLTNSPPSLARTNSSAASPDLTMVSPDIIKSLPEWVQELKPGMTADEVWERLHLAYYKHRLGGEGSPERDRWWLTWNYELELQFEPPPGGKISPDRDNRKLIRATLFKNGREISTSGK